MVDDLTCSVADVFKVLSTLDVNKANGPDAISPTILKECAAELAPSITQLFNFFLRSWQVTKCLEICQCCSNS